MEGYFILISVSIFFISIIFFSIFVFRIESRFNIRINELENKLSVGFEESKDLKTLIEKTRIMVTDLEAVIKKMMVQKEQWKDMKKAEPSHGEIVLILHEDGKTIKKCTWMQASGTFVPVEKNSYPSMYLKNTVTHWMRNIE